MMIVSSDDRPAPVVDEAVQPLEQPEERRRDHGEDAVIDDEIEALRELREHVLLLRPDVERHVDRRPVAPGAIVPTGTITPAA